MTDSMCEKPDFERAQNKATELLLQQDINSLFVDVRTFRFDKRILVDSVQNYASLINRPLTDFTCDRFSGCCVISYPRCNVILFDDDEPNECRKHWGIAHEVAHLYLGHDKDGEKEEIEANYFVAQVTTPEIVLWNICKRQGRLRYCDLTDHFNVSCEAAMKRISTMNRRRRYNSSAIDRQLLNKFTPVIERELSNGDQLNWSSIIG